MKKFVMLFVIAAFALVTINCGNPSVPQEAFRIKTRGKVHLFGLPLPISVPNGGLSVNLKTTTPSGTAGTTGTVSEFNPGGANIQTDLSGIYDARDAVLPAVWSAKIAPSQQRCSNPISNPASFSATNRSVHKLNCKWNILAQFLVEPGSIALGPGPHPIHFIPANSLTGIRVKDNHDFAVFRRFNAENLKAEFYRQVEGEDYVWEGDEYITNISGDGSQITVSVPDFSEHTGIKNYRILIREVDGDQELYIGHAELRISYGLRRNCPGIGRTCDGDELR